MSNNPSTTLTRWSEELFDGALQKNFMTPLDQSDDDTIVQQSKNTDPWAPWHGAIKWNNVHETTGGKIQFSTIIDFDAPTVSHLPENALHRIYCLLIVGHLSGKPLQEACESLVEIYTWQRDQARAIVHEPAEIRHSASGTRHVDRRPFDFDDL